MNTIRIDYLESVANEITSNYKGLESLLNNFNVVASEKQVAKLLEAIEHLETVVKKLHTV